MGEVKVSPRGSGAAWVRCPTAAAKKLILVGRVKVGWVSAHVKLLPRREVRCYKCLHTGHIRAQCTSLVDRGETFFRCGQVGHAVKECTCTEKCLLCAEAGKPADHRLGSKSCSPPPPRKTTRDRGVAITSVAPMNVELHSEDTWS